MDRSELAARVWDAAFAEYVSDPHSTPESVADAAAKAVTEWEQNRGRT